ncbi:MAG: hypothetical protein IT270_19080 [Saprospiraceae bacterium]|nr:hypothetical protein [Saprospiraceae bacterium]
MTQEPKEETIRAYLKGGLSENERQAFEAELSRDTALAESMALIRAEMAAAEWLIAQENRALFAQWKLEKQNTGANWSMGKLFILALCLVLVAGAVWYFQQKQPAPPANPETPVLPQANKEKNPVVEEKSDVKLPVQRPAGRNYLALARQHYKEPVLSTVRRTPTDTTKTPLILAREAYAAGNYKEALGLLEQVDSSRQQAADFLAANALYHLGKYPEAETKFENLVTSGSTQYRYPSEWSLLVCRLAQLPARNAVFEKQLDDVLKRPEHPYFQQAGNLKKDLKKQ